VNQVTLDGRLCDPQGIGRRREWAGGRERLEVFANPPANYRSRQPRCRLNVEHDLARLVGRLVALERNATGLWATCVSHELGLLGTRGDWYFSAESRARQPGLDRQDIELVGLAVTSTPAQVGAGPVTILAGDLTKRTRPRAVVAAGRAGARAPRACRGAGTRVRGDEDHRGAEVTPMGHGAWLVDGELHVAGSTRASLPASEDGCPGGQLPPRPARSHPQRQVKRGG